MKQFVFLVFFAILGLPLMAQDSELRSLETLDEGQEWSAVGRLIFENGYGYCTATLISADLVLTAAHCLFNPETGVRYNNQDFEFQAGWRNGRAEAYRAVRQANPHPDYEYRRRVAIENVKNDIALIQLMTPIQNPSIKPMKIGAFPKTGTVVGVVSYARDRVNAPSLQDACLVRSQQQGILLMTCSVDYGSSGSPVFVNEGGVYKVVSIVSAMADMNGRSVSLGTSLKQNIEAVKTGLIPDATFSGTSQNRRDIGARFGKVPSPLEPQ